MSMIIISTPFFYFALFISLILVFITSKLLLLFRNSSRTFKNLLPPGPPRFPIIGNLHQLKQPLHRTFYTLSLKYGHLFSLQFGSRLVVVVSSSNAAQECFTKNDVVLANRPHFLAGKYIGYNNTTVAQAPYGDHWRNLRRILALELLSSNRLNTFLEIRRDEIRRLIQKLAQTVLQEQDSKNDEYLFSKVLELKLMFSEMTFNTIMRMVSGKRYYGEDCDVSDVEEARLFREIIKEVVTLGGANNPGDFLALVRWFDFDGLEKRLKRISKRTDAFLQGLIDEHRYGKKNVNNTMIDHLLMQQQSQPEYYTDQIIKGLIVVMLLAGTDTSAVTLEWAMSNLLNHEDVIKKAKNELDTHIGQDRLVDEPDISKLPYLQSIVYETLRLHPAAPLLVPHLSSDDFTLDKYNIPRDTIVLVNAWAIHRDPKLWSDPTCFKPERFEKEGETNKLLSFGWGRRACPGANLAQRTVGLTLGLLIQCFEWKRIGDEKLDMTEEKGITVSKKISLKAMCKVRHPLIIKGVVSNL